MFKVMRKSDLILIISIIIAGIFLSVFLVFGQTEGSSLKVTVDGSIYGTYPLSKDTSVTIESDGHVNTFEIKDGKVSMTNANCKGFDCVHEGAISKEGQTIVCLPHKVVLEITGSQSELDAIVE